MSQSWLKAKRVIGATSGVESAALDREAFPELSAFLGGVPTEDRKGVLLAPHSLTMWIEGDMLHWCLQSKQEANKLFGSITAMNLGFDGIEKALEKEAFSVRKSQR